MRARSTLALMPESGEDEDGKCLPVPLRGEEDGQPDLTNIESDEEYEIVSDAFDEILDEEEFKELMEGEDAEDNED